MENKKEISLYKSEKVKEIKELIDCDKKQNKLGGIIVVNRQFLIEVINLINELESENERFIEERDLYKKQFNELEPRFFDLREENKQLKDRIAEFEKKIENGTLIELPCKVGDKFYQVIKGLPIYEWEVETIVFSKIYFPKNYVITARRTKDLAFWKFWSEDLGETIFLTKDEAEKELEKLRGKQ